MMNSATVESPKKHGNPLRGEGMSVYFHKKAKAYMATVRQPDGRYKLVGQSETYKGALRKARNAKAKMANGTGGGLMGHIKRKKGEAANASDLAAAVWLLEKTIQELITELRKM